MRSIVALAISIALSASSWAQSEITVSADAEVSAEPDIAEFHLSIIARQPLATESFKTYLATYNSLQSSLKNLVDTTKIFTDNLSVAPSFDYMKPEKITPDYYQVSAIMNLSVPISQMNQVLEKITAVEGVTINGIQFRAKEQDRLQTEALEKAVAKAHEKAATIAKLEGLSDLKIKNMSTSFVRPPVPLYGARMETLGAIPSLNASDVTVSVTITATYTATPK